MANTKRMQTECAADGKSAKLRIPCQGGEILFDGDLQSWAELVAVVTKTYGSMLAKVAKKVPPMPERVRRH